MTITLPDKPDAFQYEDAVTSHIRSLGYFTETRTILKHEGREILEIDVVASPSSEDFLKRIIFEAKSGKTGFPDIFKVYGWRMYLDIESGYILRKIPLTPLEVSAIELVSTELNIFVREFDSDAPELGPDIPVLLPCSPGFRKNLYYTCWYKAILERHCHADLNKFKKICSDPDLLDAIKKYEDACNLAFFEKHPLNRVRLLYQAFHDTPHISGQCIKYICNDVGCSERDIQDKLFDTNEYLWAQYIMILEHRARVSIIKNAVDYLYYFKNLDSLSKKKIIHEKMRQLSTPTSFQNGLSRLNRHPFCTKIPLLLQMFIEIYGGILIAGSEQDITFLADCSGIPETDVITCLDTYEEIFPTTGGWFLKSKDIHRMKMIPAIIRGIGCFARCPFHCKDYKELSSSMGWLLDKYHAAAYNALRPILGTEE